MSTGIEVTLELSWSFGLPGPTGVTYVGPGRVTLSLDQAQSIKGDNMALRVYHFKGKKYTAETLAEAPAEFLQILRSRGIAIPETKQVDRDLTEIVGVGATTAKALRDAGYKSIEDVANADEDDLSNRVDGIGPATASTIIEEAKKATG
jgi:predicted flap endonuclease-1-like 5' DNA nuclease